METDRLKQFLADARAEVAQLAGGGGAPGENAQGVLPQFFRAQQVQFFNRAQNRFPLAQVQDGGRAAAEENGFGLEIRRDDLEFADERGGVAIDEFAAGSFGIERTILAFLRAERDVNVKARDAG